jgi:DNA primase small subunit
VREINQRTKIFLKQKFKEYYKNLDDFSLNVTEPEKREWGFLFFDSNSFSRHIGFKDNFQLKDFCSRMGPSDCYHSGAYYKDPVVPNMDNKVWLGCDLIFDIDADHLDTDCKSQHDIWLCTNCGKEGKGKAPEICPSCNEKKFNEINWICSNCLDSAKNEILKVSEEFLIKDFNFKSEDIFYVFSGHRGYHIHLEADSIKKLDSSSRREIIDYIEGNGLSQEYLGFEEIAVRNMGRIIIGPKRTDYGWRGRLNRFVTKFFQELDESELKKLNFHKPKEEFIISNKQVILESLNVEKGNIPGIQGISWDFPKIKIKDWQKIIDYSIKKYSGKVDEPVTADIHRIIRLPNSLNGKTGLKVKILNHEQIKKFDPFTDPLVFEGTIKIHIKRAPRTVFNNESYGPYYDETVEIPSSIGIFLICKNVAEMLN